MLRSYRFWIGLLVSVVSLYLALQGIDFGRLLEALGQLNWLWLLPAYLIFWLSYASRVYRWQLLFSPLSLRWGQVLSALSIGYFFSAVLPARMGDVIRAYLLGVSGRVPVGRSLSTVVMERLADGLAVVVFLVVLLPIVPNLPGEARVGGLVAALVAIGALGILYAISWQRERWLGFLRQFTFRFTFLRPESLWNSLGTVIDGFAVLHSARTVIGVSAWSLSVWFFGSVLNWLVMLAMNLPLGLDAAILISVVTALVVIVPSSPGYIGVFHYVTQLTLGQVYGLDPARGLAYAVVIHAFVSLNLVLLGLWFLWHEGQSFTQLRSVQVHAE